MKASLKILILEDSPTDAEIIKRFLIEEKLDCTFSVAANKKAYLLALDQFLPDIILSDHSLPQFNSSDALVSARKIIPGVPFIMVTGTVSEEFAAEIIKMGADDYILKDRLARLPSAIVSIVKQRQAEKDKKEVEQKIIQSESNLRAIFENTSEVFLLLDREGIVRALNKKAAEYPFFVTKKELQIGDSILNFIAPARISFFKEVISKVLMEESIYYDVAHDLGDGKTQWVDFSVSPVREAGQVTGVCITGRDITERKIAENKLRLSNERYQAVAKATSDGIWDYDFASGKTYIAGTGYKHLFGYDIINEYSEGFFWESHIHPDDRARVLKQLAEAIADNNKTQAATEYRFLKADGSYAYINDRFFIMRENGKPIRMLGAKQDITVKKKAEEELEKNFYEKQKLAERMSAILNTLPANIALLDENGIIVDVNDSWRNFADGNGFIGSNCGIGDNYLDISKGSFGKEKEEGKTIANGIRDVLKNELREFMFEYSCHSPEIKRWFRMVATPLQEKEYAGAVVMHIDISELRRK